jgi:hypothetical protein
MPPPPPIGSAPETPVARRWVGVTTRWHGNGTLWIYPGRLILRFDRLSALLTGVDRLTHTARHVRLIVPRLLPMVSAVVLDDGNQRVRVDVSAWKGRSIRQQLLLAGFDVMEERTWVGTGILEMRQMAADPRGRPAHVPSTLATRTRILWVLAGLAAAIIWTAGAVQIVNERRDAVPAGLIVGGLALGLCVGGFLGRLAARMMATTGSISPGRWVTVATLPIPLIVIGLLWSDALPWFSDLSMLTLGGYFGGGAIAFGLSYEKVDPSSGR